MLIQLRQYVRVRGLFGGCAARTLVIRLLLCSLAVGLFLAGCATTEDEYDRNAAALSASIAAEPLGNYYIARRFYRRDYFFWGFVRKPRQPWSAAQLVMLNEQKCLAPDRAANAIGSDADTEYRLDGYFSGQTVYEPASNSFYPEFVLRKATVISTDPLPIFRDPHATDPNRLVIDRPE